MHYLDWWYKICEKLWIILFTFSFWHVSNAFHILVCFSNLFERMWKIWNLCLTKCLPMPGWCDCSSLFQCTEWISKSVQWLYLPSEMWHAIRISHLFLFCRFSAVWRSQDLCWYYIDILLEKLINKLILMNHFLTNLKWYIMHHKWN